MSGCFEPGLLGCRVRLSTEEGEYRGTVHAVGARDASVTLVGVTFACGGGQEALRGVQKFLRGVQKFLRGDVRAIEVLESGPAALAVTAQDGAPPAGPDRAVLGGGGGVKPVFSQRLVDDSLLLAQVAAADDSDDSSGGGGDGAAPRRPRAASPPPLLPRPEGYALLESAAELADAAEFLARQTTLGLAAEGVLLGRGGQLSLLSLACAEFVFLVDVVACGGTAAVRALRPLLEDRRVQKAVHDSRALSDLLWHQFGVRLANVFDTQAAEVYLYQRRHGAVPAYVSNVAHTLVTRLKLLPRQVFFPRQRLERMREDQAVWMRRPLSDWLLEGAVKNVVYLRELRQVQLDAMLAQYVTCVDAFLQTVRDADDEDAAAAPFETHRVPVRVQRILEAPARRPRAPPDLENPGLVNNVLFHHDNEMQFTRNIWRAERN